MKYIITILLLLATEGKTADELMQAPVICYHNIYESGDQKPDVMHISRSQLSEQLKSLANSGYHTILPDQLWSAITKKTPLPSHPVIITFDDSHREHFTIAAPLLEQYGFRGVFFVMTVTIGKPGYLTSEQIKALSGRGHIIGVHTWDHPHLKNMQPADVEKQLIQPKKILENITGLPTPYFAYPFGEWNEWLVGVLKKNGFKAAFQLAGKQSTQDQLYTINRLLVDGRWQGSRLQQQISQLSKD